MMQFPLYAVSVMVGLGIMSIVPYSIPMTKHQQYGSPLRQEFVKSPNLSAQ